MKEWAGLGDEKPISSPSGFRFPAIQTRSNIPVSGERRAGTERLRVPETRPLLHLTYLMFMPPAADNTIRKRTGHFRQTPKEGRLLTQERHGNWLSTRKIFQNDNSNRTARDDGSHDRSASVMCAQSNVQSSRLSFNDKHANQISFFCVRNQPSNNSVRDVLSSAMSNERGE